MKDIDWPLTISVINLFLLILGPLGLNFINGFLTEKGKGLATRKDIEEVTTKVKKVESMFSISTSGEIDFNTIKRNAIFEYYNSLNTWYSYFFTFNFYYDENHQRDNEELIKTLKKAQLEFGIKEAGLEFFIPTDHFKVLSRNAERPLMLMLKNLRIHCNEIEKVHLDFINDISGAYDAIRSINQSYYTEFAENAKEFKTHKTRLIYFLDDHIKSTFKKVGY